jgi:acetyl esterase/lipase
MRTGFPPPTGIDIESMRERAEALHKKINEKLIGTFQGQEIEKKVEIKGKPGGFFQNKINNLEIPITIYTPINVNRDKIVVFFHGGGKNKSLFLFKKFRKM